jgi:hypothetical protein
VLVLVGAVFRGEPAKGKMLVLFRALENQDQDQNKRQLKLV